MNFVVFNGSPKGYVSITLQYIKFIQKHCSHKLKVFNISHDINQIEKEPTLFQNIIKEVKSSDGIIWATPVYHFLIPSQLKRFIELIFERNVHSSFEGKYAATIMTSAHFYDDIAHNYLNGICDDLETNYFGGYLAEMYDLTKPKEQENLMVFANSFFNAAETLARTEIIHPSITYKPTTYNPENITISPKTRNKRVVVLTDEDGDRTNLGKMIRVFISSVPFETEVINISKINIKGGCLGCVNCTYDGICIYTDDYKKLFEEKLISADIIIYAGNIKDRYLSSKWKTFFDRSFYNGHRHILINKQIGYILSGPLRQIPNLRQICEARSQLANNLVGIVTDEYDNSQTITELIQHLAVQIAKYAEKNACKPRSFLGLAGHLVFRDLVYNIKASLRADHIYYKKHGLYDYPQRNIKQRLLNGVLSLLIKIPIERKNATKYLIKPLEKIVGK